MRKIIGFGLVAGLLAGSAAADVALLEGQALRQRINKQGKAKAERSPLDAQKTSAGTRTGEQALLDASGLEYFVNTNITFSTTSSASGAASEASYTAAVAATTIGAGTVMSTLSDAFDGYNSLCVSLTGALGPCSTGDPDFTIYNDNGAGTLECNGRQIVLNPQVVGTLSIRRKIFVPDNDEFARWLNIVTNTGGAPQAVSLVTANNLGSDSNTVVDQTSDADATPELTDTWVSTFENYIGTTSSDVRLGHVLRGATGAVGLASISFVDGDDNPFWGYTLTVDPGETVIVMNFVTGQPSRAAAAAKAADLATLPDNALQCLSETEAAQVVNFSLAPVPSVLEIPTVSPVGLVLLAMLLVAVALVALKRRAA